MNDKIVATKSSVIRVSMIFYPECYQLVMIIMEKFNVKCYPHFGFYFGNYKT